MFLPSQLQNELAIGSFLRVYICVICITCLQRRVDAFGCVRLCHKSNILKTVVACLSGEKIRITIGKKRILMALSPKIKFLVSVYKHQLESTKMNDPPRLNHNKLKAVLLSWIILLAFQVRVL